MLKFLPLFIQEPIQQFLADHTVMPMIVGIACLIIVLDIVGSLQGEKNRKIAVVFLGAAMLGYLDAGSLFLLLGLSIFLFVVVRLELPVKRFLYPLLFVILAILICIKDHTLFLKIDKPWVPLGVSYYFFRLISFLIEYANGKAGYRNVSLLEYFSWVFFFPTFLAGPILRFHEFKLVAPNIHRPEKLRHFAWFFGALALKLALVDHYLSQQTYVELLPAVRETGSILLLGIFGMLAFLHAYFDLMLYTEMSKALAGYLGFTNVENFNRPLLATNISQFWQRWHMSLSGWTRDYVFFPTLIKSRKMWFSSYASMLTIAFWHSISLNWLVWGLLHGTALNFYSYLRSTGTFKQVQAVRGGKTLLLVSGNAVTIFFVSIVFILVAFHDLKTPVELFRLCLLGKSSVGK